VEAFALGPATLAGMAAMQFRFRPRYRGLALSAIGLGAATLVAAAIWQGALGVWIAGALGVALGALYLVSPTWRIVVHVDDDALEVTSGGARRFRLPWGDVVELVVSRSTRTCFVNGGDPERSLLVPGDGAPAPYDIERRGDLCDAIVARAPRDRIVEVELLERYTRPQPPPA